MTAQKQCSSSLTGGNSPGRRNGDEADTASTVHLTIRRHRREAPLQRKRGLEAVPPHGSSPSRRPFPPAQDTAANSISGGRKHTHM